jgi:hypothetical protein
MNQKQLSSKQNQTHFKYIITVCVFLAIGLSGFSLHALEFTGECPPTGTTCMANQEIYHPGDTFILSVKSCNHEKKDLNVALFLLFEIYGQFYFWPTFDKYFDYSIMTIPACSCVSQTIFEFVISKKMAEIDFTIWNAMMDEELTEILGQVSVCPILIVP